MVAGQNNRVDASTATSSPTSDIEFYKLNPIGKTQDISGLISLIEQSTSGPWDADEKVPESEVAAAVSGPVDGLAAMDFGTTSLGLYRSIAIPTYADGTTPGSSVANFCFVGSAEFQGLEKQQSSFGRQAQWFGEGRSKFP